MLNTAVPDLFIYIKYSLVLEYQAVLTNQQAGSSKFSMD